MASRRCFDASGLGRVSDWFDLSLSLDEPITDGVVLLSVGPYVNVGASCLCGYDTADAIVWVDEIWTE